MSPKLDSSGSALDQVTATKTTTRTFPILLSEKNWKIWYRPPGIFWYLLIAHLIKTLGLLVYCNEDLWIRRGSFDQNWRYCWNNNKTERIVLDISKILTPLYGVLNYPTHRGSLKLLQCCIRKLTPGEQYKAGVNPQRRSQRVSLKGLKWIIWS